MKNFRTEGAPRRGGFGGGERGGRGGFGGGDRGRGGFGGGDRGRGGFGGRDSGAPRTMHKTTCAECGKVCEVPFRPTGEKPVFCSTCFADRGDRMEERSERPSRFAMDRQAPTERHQVPKVDNSRLEEKLEVISAKLDKLFSLLIEKAEKTEESKPVKAKAVKEIKEEKPKKAVVKKAAPKKVAKKK